MLSLPLSLCLPKLLPLPKIKKALIQMQFLCTTFPT